MAGPFTGAEAASAGAGTFTFGGSSVLNIMDFTNGEEVAMHDVTPAGSTHRVFNHGLKTSNGTFVALHDTSAATLAVGTRGQIVATVYTGRVYTIQAVIEKADITFRADGLCEVTYSWRQTPASVGSVGSSSDYSKT